MTKSKRKRRIMKEFRIDEISGVDRPAQTTATVAIMKRRTDDNDDGIEKRALLTTATDGHTHLIIDEVGPAARAMGGRTDYVDSSDGGRGHSHPWILDPDSGAITIGMAAGHVHTAMASWIYPEG